jgi:hypothetical protein
MPSYGLDQVMRAQAALRSAAGMPPEAFPLEAFVGMVSDEIESLRTQGRNDEEIAGIIWTSSGISIDAATLAENYAPAKQRHRQPQD